MSIAMLLALPVGVILVAAITMWHTKNTPTITVYRDIRDRPDLSLPFRGSFDVRNLYDIIPYYNDPATCQHNKHIALAMSTTEPGRILCLECMTQQELPVTWKTLIPVLDFPAILTGVTFTPNTQVTPGAIVIAPAQAQQKGRQYVIFRLHHPYQKEIVTQL